MNDCHFGVSSANYPDPDLSDVVELDDNQLTPKCTTPTPLVLNASPDVTIP